MRNQNLKPATKLPRNRMAINNVKYWLGEIDILEKELNEHLTVHEKSINRAMNLFEGKHRYTHTPKDVFHKAVEYFRRCVDNQMPLSFTGLAEAMGTPRATMYSWAKLEGFKKKRVKTEAFVYIVRMLINFVEFYLEIDMYIKQNPTSNIFSLKALGWKDDGKPLEAQKIEVGFTVQDRKEIRKHLKSLTEDKK